MASVLVLLSTFIGCNFFIVVNQLDPFREFFSVSKLPLCRLEEQHSFRRSA